MSNFEAIEKIQSGMEKVNLFLGPVYPVDTVIQEAKDQSGRLSFIDWRISRDNNRLMTSIENIEKADGNLDRLSKMKWERGSNWRETVNNVAAELDRQEIIARYGFMISSSIDSNRLVIKLKNKNGDPVAKAILEPHLEESVVHDDKQEPSDLMIFSEDEMETTENGKEVAPEHSALYELAQLISKRAYIPPQSKFDVSEHDIVEFETMEVRDSKDLTSPSIRLDLLENPEIAKGIESWASQNKNRKAHRKMDTEPSIG